MTSRKCHCFERSKKSLSFRAKDDTITVPCLAFLYFPAINIFRDLFLRDLVSLLRVYFLCYTKGAFFISS